MPQRETCCVSQELSITLGPCQLLHVPIHLPDAMQRQPSGWAAAAFCTSRCHSPCLPLCSSTALQGGTAPCITLTCTCTRNATLQLCALVRCNAGLWCAVALYWDSLHRSIPDVRALIMNPIWDSTGSISGPFWVYPCTTLGRPGSLNQPARLHPASSTLCCLNQLPNACQP